MSTVPSPSTAGTDLPAARAPDAGHRLGGPARVGVREALQGLAEGAGLAVVRPPGGGGVFAPKDRDLVKASGPWGPDGITERPRQAAGPGLWAEPDARTPQRPRATYLEPEGDLEGDDK